MVIDLTAARRGLAANPALPFDLLLPLADSTDRPTLVALAGRSDLTRTAARRLAGTGEAAVRLTFARNPVAVVHVWDLLVDDPDVTVRAELADHSWRFGGIPEDFPLPEPAQVRLSGDPDPQVRRRMAFRRDPALSAGYRLAADPSAEVRRELVRHWRRPPADLVQSWLIDPDPQIRRAALFTSVPPADLVAGLLADPATRADAAELVHLDLATAETLAGDPDSAVREMLARNPTLPKPLMLRLADDPDEDVRAEIMLRPELPADVRSRVVASVEPQDYHLAHWLTRATLDVRLANVDSPFAFHRRAVAMSKGLPAAAIARLATDEDFSVRLLLAENQPQAPAELFATVIPRTGHAAWPLSSHPSIPADLLVAMAASTDDKQRNVAASSPHLPPSTAAHLADHPTVTTRKAVAGNQALPIPDILRLLHDPAHTVVTAAASNPRFPPAQTHELMSGLRNHVG